MPEVPPRAVPFDAVPEVFFAGLFDELLLDVALFAAVPLFLAAALLPFAPDPVFAGVEARDPLFAAAFGVLLLAAVLVGVFFAVEVDPDFALPDFATDDLAVLVLDVPDFAELDLAPPDFAAPDFPVDDFAADDLAELDLFAPPLFAPPAVRELELVASFAPATVSAAAPRAPTAAPDAAPLKILLAASSTASITFSVVDFFLLDDFPELFALDDADDLPLLCFVFFLSAIMSSQVLVIELFVQIKN